MEMVIRSLDVGYGYTKYVTGTTGPGSCDIRCASFPSLAYPFPRDPRATLGADRRNTVAIPIAGMFYEVGPDVMLAADAFRATQIHDGYVDTPEYLALALGALRMMRVEAIDLLVVGLPVAIYSAKKNALEKLMTGSHDVGGGKTVLVHKALAMAQPNGALIDYASQHDQVVAMENEHSLVIDPGSRTFDWLVARGMKLSHKRSHSVNRGISDILQIIADDISAEIGRPYNQLDAIDLALRTGKNLTIFQKSYSITRMRPVVDSVAKQAVGAMMRRIGEIYDVRHVILVGGGAFLFKKAVKEAFTTHQILEVKEPMFSNLRGFQIAGANYAYALMQASSHQRSSLRPEGERA